ncbi:MAG: hypothetical protein AABY88_12585 [Pseudomonadota bacterium]
MSDTLSLSDIRSCPFLVELRDDPGNFLTIVVEEANGLGEPTDLSENIPIELRSILPESRPIISVAGDRMIEIMFSYPVGYAVLNESYASSGEPDAFKDFIRRATFASDDYPGKLEQFSIVTHNHVIEVMSDSAPVLNVISVQPTAITH